MPQSYLTTVGDVDRCGDHVGDSIVRGVDDRDNQ